VISKKNGSSALLCSTNIKVSGTRVNEQKGGEIQTSLIIHRTVFAQIAEKYVKMGSTEQGSR
jgi:hypothetical protein